MIGNRVKERKDMEHFGLQFVHGVCWRNRSICYGPSRGITLATGKAGLLGSQQLTNVLLM